MPADQRGQLARAVALFNASEHRKTLYGVIRSLGAPYVHVGPVHEEVLVELLVAWELCWYRFEADLEGDIVHRRAQGYELTELERRSGGGQRGGRSGRSSRAGSVSWRA